MRLMELSAAYQESAALLRLRIRELRVLEQAQEAEEEARQLRQRINMLTPICREMQELAEFTAHYYDRSRK